MAFNTYHIHFHTYDPKIDKKLTKIMASLAQFEQALSRIDQATRNQGLTEEQETALLSRTEGLASALEAMGKSPENPVPEEPNGPVV
jgi:hypothetical protein